MTQDQAALPQPAAAPAQPDAAQPRSKIYTNSELARELRQGEIITDLTSYVYNPVENSALPELSRYSIIFTQDCDLLQAFEKVQRGEPAGLENVLFFQAELVAEIRPNLGGSDIWKRIRQNNDDRYHLLEAIAAEDDLAVTGILEMIVDFKRYYTLPVSEVYRQTAPGVGAHRRTRLEVPYKEHFQLRASNYFARVGLPSPHRWTVR